MALEFTPREWDRLNDFCGFTDEEQEIIRLWRRHGSSWTNQRYAAEMNMAPRTYDRRVSRIKQKINGANLA